jgi:hypothetical protein
MDNESKQVKETDDVIVENTIYENTATIIKSLILTELVTDTHYGLNPQHAIFISDIIYDTSEFVFEVMVTDQTADGVDSDKANDELIKTVKENIKNYVSLMTIKTLELEKTAGEFYLDLLKKPEKQVNVEEQPKTGNVEEKRKDKPKRTKNIEKYFLST